MSAPIQASASVQVVPASNCVRSSTRIPVRQPGHAGVTSIVDSLSGRKLSPRERGSGQAAVVPLDSRFADQPSRTYPNRPLPDLSEFDDVRLVLSLRWRKTYSNHRFLVGPEGQYELASCVPSAARVNREICRRCGGTRPATLPEF